MTTSSSSPGIGVSGDVEGVREAMKVLAAIEPALKRQAMKDIKTAAEPLRAAIAISIPASAPLSGMDHRGRTGWQASGARTVGTKYGGKRIAGTNSWPLVSILVKGVAGSIYDMAGAGSGGGTPQGSALIAGLTSQGGIASRAAWPAAESRLMTIQANVANACQKVSDDASRKLAAGGTL